MRTYELVFIVDPRLADEELVSLANDYRAMISANGGQVVKEESWGKRRLAYPIRKLTEGRYHLFQITTDGENPFPEVEQRMQQNEKVLRYLTVRTDEGRLRVRDQDAASAGFGLEPTDPEDKIPAPEERD